MTTKISLNNLQSSVVTSISSAASSAGPKISAVTYPNNAIAARITGGEMITITGSGFTPNSNVFIETVGCTTTYVSNTSLTFTSPAKSLGSYHLYVYNSDGSFGLKPGGISFSDVPIWSTASGALASAPFGIAYTQTVSATGDSTLTYSVTSGSLPTGLSLISANGAITGTPTGSLTTSTFTITATDAELQTTSRSFSIQVLDPTLSFTISPAINGMTTWTPTSNGDLVITTAGEYTLVPNINGSKVVKMWGGAGKPATVGDGWGGSGAGGAANGTISFVAGTTYKFRVGNNGSTGSPSATAYGAGAGHPSLFPNGGQGYAGSGGGYTGIFNTTVSQANAIMMAGGGGGGAGSRSDARGGRWGTAGGGTTGQYVADLVATPGTQSAAGENGGALQGGNGQAAGASGGGGGYYGGGAMGNHGDGGYGGAGGSGYYNPSVVSGATLYIGNGMTPGNSTDASRPTNAGAGNYANSTVYPGAIVIKA